MRDEGGKDLNFHAKPNLYVQAVTLNVRDINKSVIFYTDLLGFKILEQDDKKALLTVDGIHPMIVLHQPDNVTPKQVRTTGLYHFAILLPTREDLGSMLLHLLKNKFPIGGASDHLVSEALYFNDPDGNGIEIYCDRPKEQWTWKENQVEMSTDPLDAESLLAAGSQADWRGMPNETVIGHIHLHVANLQEAEDFYTNILGYDVVCKYGGQALFLSTGSYHHHVAINTWSGIGAPKPAENSVGLTNFTLSLPNNEAKIKIIDSLKENQYPYTEIKGTLQVNDPSGNHITFFVEE